MSEANNNSKKVGQLADMMKQGIESGEIDVKDGKVIPLDNNGNTMPFADQRGNDMADHFDELSPEEKQKFIDAAKTARQDLKQTDVREQQMGDKVNEQGDNTIKIGDKVVDKDTVNISDDPLMAKLEEMRNQNKADGVNDRLKAIEAGEVVPNVVAESDNNSAVSENDVFQILEEMEEQEEQKNLGLVDEEDLFSMLEKLDEAKVYTTYAEPEEDEHNGPADYIEVDNEDYKENILEVCDLNNIRILKNKNGTARNAILNNFTNSGRNISLPLVNSGIWIAMSGMGTAEIIAMNQMEHDSSLQVMELQKMQHISRHITDSSVGKLSTKNLIQVVSYWDRDTLFYGAYGATFPKTDLERTCMHCRQPYYVDTDPKELLINGAVFEKQKAYIKTDIDKLTDLIKSSKLGKVGKFRHKSGMIITFKHPSIADYIRILSQLTDETRAKYASMLAVVFGVESLLIPDVNKTTDEFIEFTEPNDIIKILATLPSASDRFDIVDKVQDIIPNEIPQYGYKAARCPHCGSVNPSQAFTMDAMLFTSAQKKEERDAMMYAARKQKETKMKKAKRNV